MSTATEEPPVVAEPEKSTLPPERAAAAADFLRPKVQVDGIISKAPEPTPKKEEPAKVEPVKTDAIKTDDAKLDPKEMSIGELRKRRDEAEKLRDQLQKDLETEKAERARIAAEYEEFKKQPAPKEVTERITALEAEKQRLDQELRATAVERSSYYKETFTDPINANATIMRDVMVQSGMSMADANKAITEWNEDALGEAVSNMSPGQEVKFKSAWGDASRLDIARRQVLSKPDEHHKKMEQQQQEAIKQQQEQGQAFLKGEEDALFRELGEQDYLKANPDLLKAARESVGASYQMPPKEIMRHIAAARLLAENNKLKDGEIAKLKADYEELKTKHAEQEAFIKNQNVGTARVSPTDPPEKPEDRKAKANSFLFPDVRSQ